mgnify:CR=1 FL=1
MNIPTDFQRDCMTLRSIADEVSALAGHMAQAQNEMGARERGYFLPNEDDQVRRILLAYRNYRIALFEIIHRYREIEEFDQAEEQTLAFLLAFGSAVILFNWSSLLVDTYRDIPHIRAKLNEADARFGMPANLFEQICDSLSNAGNLVQLRDAADTFADHEDWHTSAAVNGDFAWLTDEIERQYEQVRRSHIDIFRGHLGRRLQNLQDKAKQPLRDASYLIRSWVMDVFGNTWLTLADYPTVPEPHIDAFLDLLQPGDFFIVRPEQKASTVFLPGWWTHVALYHGGIKKLRAIGADRCRHVAATMSMLGDDSLVTIEALAAGVVCNPIERTLRVDHALAVRPRLTLKNRLQAIDNAFGHFGKRYDFGFDFSRSDRLVCTELLYRSYHGLNDIAFTPVMRLGRPTISADDVAAYIMRTLTDNTGTFELLAMSFKTPDNGAQFLTGEACRQRFEMTVDT